VPGPHRGPVPQRAAQDQAVDLVRHGDHHAVAEKQTPVLVEYGKRQRHSQNDVRRNDFLQGS
jgi:hypothetical protein